MNDPKSLGIAFKYKDFVFFQYLEALNAFLSKFFFLKTIVFNGILRVGPLC